MSVIGRVWRTVVPPAWGVLSGCVLGCQPTPAPVPPASPSPEAGVAAGAPVPPRPSITGCVESPELKRYVLALEARRGEARAAALDALGARVAERTAVFASAGTTLGLDQTFDANGKRWVVAAEVASGFAPEARLATLGNVLHRIEEHPRASARPVLACGVQRCPPTEHTPAVPLPVRPVLVELGPGEAWGGPLVVAYDYAWANVSYDRAEACPPGQAPAPRRSQPRASSATP